METNTDRMKHLDPDFLLWLGDVAHTHGKALDQVYSWWREYCTDCRNFDQSPIQFEFLQWYEAALTGGNTDPQAVAWSHPELGISRGPGL